MRSAKMSLLSSCSGGLELPVLTRKRRRPTVMPDRPIEPHAVPAALGQLASSEWRVSWASGAVDLDNRPGSDGSSRLHAGQSAGVRQEAATTRARSAAGLRGEYEPSAA